MLLSHHVPIIPDLGKHCYIPSRFMRRRAGLPKSPKSGRYINFTYFFPGPPTPLGHPTPTSSPDVPRVPRMPLYALPPSRVPTDAAALKLAIDFLPLSLSSRYLPNPHLPRDLPTNPDLAPPAHLFSHHVHIIPDLGKHSCIPPRFLRRRAGHPKSPEYEGYEKFTYICFWTDLQPLALDLPPASLSFPCVCACLNGLSPFEPCANLVDNLAFLAIVA